MKVRSNYPGYMEAVERYFGKLIPLISDLQVNIERSSLLSDTVTAPFGKLAFSNPSHSVDEVAERHSAYFLLHDSSRLRTSALMN